MLKKRVSAKEAAVDIRAGMDDAALMKKYNLSPEGLQSLLDKLIHAGFIDLGEVENRLQGILGAAVVSEPAISRPEDRGKNGSEPLKDLSSPLVNAQEAARDIRLGLTDQALMAKYRLSFKGLQSLFHKLMSAGLITQPDLARRMNFEIDHTVDLREERLSFRDALQQLGLDHLASSRADLKTLPRKPPTIQPVASFPGDETTAPHKDYSESPSRREATQNVRQTVRAWYDNHAILGLLLVSPLCPIGLYGLFRNIALSYRVKAVILLAWVGFATAVSLLIKQMV